MRGQIKNASSFGSSGDCVELKGLFVNHCFSIFGTGVFSHRMVCIPVLCHSITHVPADEPHV